MYGLLKLIISKITKDFNIFNAFVIQFYFILKKRGVHKSEHTVL